MKLLSTTDYVKYLTNVTPELEQQYKDETGGVIEWSMWCWRKVQTHSEMISKTPELWMFVACDESGKYLEKPEKYDSWEVSKKEGLEPFFTNEAECEKYKQANEKVIFKNWKYGKSEELNAVIDFLYTEDIKNWRERPHIGIEGGELHLSYLRDNIEALIKLGYNLEYNE